jgi:hypothetical protein
VAEVASRIRHLRLTATTTVAVLVLATVVGGLAGGPVAALGVAAGAALVGASYVATTLVVAWVDSVAPRMVLAAGVGMYVIKFSLFGAMLIAVTDAGWAGRIPMAWGIVLGVLAWTGTHIWWMARNAYPNVGYAVIPDRPDDAPGGG